MGGICGLAQFFWVKYSNTPQINAPVTIDFVTTQGIIRSNGHMEWDKVAFIGLMKRINKTEGYRELPLESRDSARDEPRLDCQSCSCLVADFRLTSLVIPTPNDLRHHQAQREDAQLPSKVLSPM